MSKNISVGSLFDVGTLTTLYLCKIPNVIMRPEYPSESAKRATSLDFKRGLLCVQVSTYENRDIMQAQCRNV